MRLCELGRFEAESMKHDMAMTDCPSLRCPLSETVSDFAMPRKTWILICIQLVSVETWQIETSR